MARPKGINQKARYRAHSIRMSRYAGRVQSVYDALNREVASFVARTGYDGTKPFRFSDYPSTRRAMEQVQASFVNDMRSVVYSGTSEEWRQSNLVQDLLADKTLKFYGATTNGKKHKVYYQTNSDALKAFQERRDKGMNLSQKLWNQSKNYKEEMEFAISSAIEKGTSAVKLSKRLSKYLNDFPSLKKDYKEKYGKAVTCQDCEYRSMRLARTEINMAYRKAEQERWKQFDFVLGYEVKLSSSHPKEDICDGFAGKYPKNFTFLGWHPNCLCYVVPILKSEDEFFGNTKTSEEVTEYPQPVMDWLGENEERIAAAREAGTLPYFFENNDETLVRAYFDSDGSTQIGYVNIFAERKYMKEASGKFLRYGTREEVLSQLAQWDELTAAMDAIEGEFDAACLRTVAKTQDTTYTGLSRKTLGSALRKADTMYGGDLSQLEDLIRCSFCCRSDEYLKVVETVRREMPIYKDLSTRQYMHTQKADAYICRFMNVGYANGAKGEIMVNPVEMIVGRESREMSIRYLGKDLYEKIRLLAEKEGIELHKGHIMYEKFRICKTVEEKVAAYKEVQEYMASLSKVDPYAKAAKAVTASDAKLMRDMAMKNAEALDKMTNDIARAHGGRCTPINMKSEESILRKSRTDKTTPYTLKDVVRTTIIVPPDKIDAVIADLKKAPGFMRHKAQFGPQFYGYTGNIVNIEMSNGVIAEVQVNTPAMIFGKEPEKVARMILGDKVWEQIQMISGMEGGLGHKYYEEIRILDLVKDKKKIEELAAKSEKYYSRFRDLKLGKKAGKRKRTKS